MPSRFCPTANAEAGTGPYHRTCRALGASAAVLLLFAGCSTLPGERLEWSTGFDDVDGWTVSSEGDGAGRVEVVDWPAEAYTDPITGEIIALGGSVARVTHGGTGDVVVSRQDMPGQGIITIYIKEATPSGDGRARLQVRSRDAAGAELAYGVGSFTSAPPGEHWNDFGSEEGFEPNDYVSHFVVQPQRVSDGPFQAESGVGVAHSDVVMPTAMRRGEGWHQLQIHVTPHGTWARVDGANVVRAMPAQEGVLPVSAHLKHLDGVAFGMFPGTPGSGDVLFDEFSFAELPPRRSMENLAADQLDSFLLAYGRLSDPDQLSMVEGARRLPRGRHGSLWNSIHDGMALMWTYAWTATAHGIRYRLDGNADDGARALRIIRLLMRDYPNWRTEATDEPTISSVVLQSLLTACWFVWDDLTTVEQAAIKDMALSEVQAIEGQLLAGEGIDHPFGSEFIGDSTAEQNSLPAGNYLHLMWLFPGDALADYWLDRLRFYSYHTITDSGSPPNGGVRTQTLWDAQSVARANVLVEEHVLVQALDPGHDDSHLMDNHNFHPHPNYSWFAASPSYWQAWLERFAAEVPDFGSTLQRDALLRTLQFVDLETFRFRGERIYRLPRVGQEEIFDPTTPNVFQVTGLDDWGIDGLDLSALYVMSTRLGAGTYEDPITGHVYDDLLDHALSVAHYMDHASLRVWVPPGTRFGAPDDFDRSDHTALAHAWEMRNRPTFGTTYFTMFSDAVRPPDVGAHTAHRTRSIVDLLPLPPRIPSLSATD